MKNRVNRDITNLFEHEDYIEYKSNGNRNRTLSVEEYLNKIRPCLKDIINNIKEFNTWKIINNSNSFYFF